MRQNMLFNDGWLFREGEIALPKPRIKGPVYTQSKTARRQVGPASVRYYDEPDPYLNCGLQRDDRWQRITLPHDYMIAKPMHEEENNALGYFHYENAWYRKHFKLEDETGEGKRVLLRFDGISTRSEIYVNGCLMARNFSAFNTFEVDVTDVVVWNNEDNVLAVYVNTDEFEGWWYQGGGIYRDVWLTITDEVAIDLWGVYAPARKLDGDVWQINLQTTVVNAGYEPAEVTAHSTLLAPDGTAVAEAEGSGSVALREKGTLAYTMKVRDPALWDCEHPNLYTVDTTLFRRGEPVDRVTTRVGFRTIEASAEGLFLNGRKTVLKGVCAHQDFGLTGLAVPANVARYKMKLLKEMGANALRTSHYMQTASYLDACDELGILVMDETRWYESTEESFRQLDALVLRDRNRPSVIFWSTGNEESGHVTASGRRIHRAMCARIRQLDNTRLLTTAVSVSPEKCTVYDDCDVIGVNYNLGLYDGIHAAYPDKAVFASECCATGTTRDWHHPIDANGRTRDRDYDTNSWFRSREASWRFLAGRPYVIGGFQWIAFEHRGEAVWPAVCSASGAIDLFLQKKGAFYQNQSHWCEEPMAHILPHWNFRGLEGQSIPVTVYTNCDEVELFLNGESLGRRAVERYVPVDWTVTYVPGTLSVKGFVGGREAVADTRVTTGAPTALRLTPVFDFANDGRDLALFVCECLDAEGRVVPDAEPFVRFSAASPARLIGTGSDNCDHTPVPLPERQMYMGKILVAVRPAPGQTEISLFARSSGLASANLTLTADENGLFRA